MAEPALKRIEIDGLPEAVVLAGGTVRFRHYQITGHAMDRFAQRYNRPAEEIIQALHSAAYVDEANARTQRVRRLVESAARRGSYILSHAYVYFVVKPNPLTGVHVVCTALAVPG